MKFNKLVKALYELKRSLCLVRHIGLLQIFVITNKIEKPLQGVDNVFHNKYKKTRVEYLLATGDY